MGKECYVDREARRDGYSLFVHDVDRVEYLKTLIDEGYGKLKSGEIKGEVMHTNTMADLDLESYDVACAWMDEHGDEEFPELVK